MDLHDQLKLQQEQESQMSKELDTLLNRFAQEYAVTKCQMAAILEEKKLRCLGFFQPSPGFFELFDKLHDEYGDE